MGEEQTALICYQTPSHCYKVTSEIKGGQSEQELCLSNYKCTVKLKSEFLQTLKGLTDNFDVSGHQHPYARDQITFEFVS